MRAPSLSIHIPTQFNRADDNTAVSLPNSPMASPLHTAAQAALVAPTNAQLNSGRTRAFDFNPLTLPQHPAARMATVREDPREPIFILPPPPASPSANQENWPWVANIKKSRAGLRRG